MDDKQKQDWYRPAEPPDAPDIPGLSEAPVQDNEELLREYASAPQPEKKRSRKGLWIGLAAILVLLGLIIGTAVFFSRDEEDFGQEGDSFDYSQFFDEFDGEGTITGENTIPRADTAPDVKLILESSQGPEALELQELYDQCIPSVVGITARISANRYAWGTGIVMTGDGYILTNTHVLDDAGSAEVTLYDGTLYEAKLVGADAVSDVAVLKIEADGLTPARFADSSQVRVGDTAIAIGNPLSGTFSGTMTNGIISGVDRGVNYNGHSNALLQTNAALNEGNSGGPLFNAFGQVIGITNMKMMTTSTSTVEGIGFAIPTTTVKTVAEALLAAGEFRGRPCLGITVYELEATDEAPGGLLVNSVSEASDAWKQGIRKDDILTHLDGEPITGFDTVKDRIEELNVGDSVELTIWREGKVLTKTVALADQNDV